MVLFIACFPRNDERAGMEFFSSPLKICLTAACLMLAGCAGGSDPFKSFLSPPGDQTVQAQDFVKAARPDPDTIDYVPVGFEIKPRKTPVRSAAQIAVDDASLKGVGGQAHGRAKVTEESSQQPVKKKKRKKPGEPPQVSPNAN